MTADTTPKPDFEGFARAILEQWPTSDIDRADLFELSVSYGMISEVPGGYDPEHHIDAEGICPERGDPWYEYTFRGEAGPGPYSVLILKAQRDEARRRRDEWRKKAEGYDAVRLALREKVGDPWPPHMSRVLWAGIAADEKKRADDAEAEIAALREARGLDRELAYQNYINEPTPNGNTRIDNILGCIAPCSAKVELHVATQIDMAFQAGWRSALAALELAPVTVGEAARVLLAAYDGFLDGDDQTEAEKELMTSVARAACFAASAYDAGMAGGNDIHALARSFLIALIDTNDVRLDYLRSDPKSGQTARDAANRALADAGDAGEAG